MLRRAIRLQQSAKNRASALRNNKDEPQFETERGSGGCQSSPADLLNIPCELRANIYGFILPIDFCIYVDYPGSKLRGTPFTDSVDQYSPQRVLQLESAIIVWTSNPKTGDT